MLATHSSTRHGDCNPLLVPLKTPLLLMELVLLDISAHRPRSRVSLLGDRGGAEKLKLDGRFGEPSCNLRVLHGMGCDVLAAAYEKCELDDDEEAVDEGDGVAAELLHGLSGLSGVDEIELSGELLLHMSIAVTLL